MGENRIQCSLYGYRNITCYGKMLLFCFAVGPLITLLLGWRRLPLHYWLFALAIALFSIDTYAMSSNPARCYPRFMMVAFPLFLLFAQWSKTRPVVAMLLALCFLIMLTVNSVLFVTGHWVA